MQNRCSFPDFRHALCTKKKQFFPVSRSKSPTRIKDHRMFVVISFPKDGASSIISACMILQLFSAMGV